MEAILAIRFVLAGDFGILDSRVVSPIGVETFRDELGEVIDNPSYFLLIGFGFENLDSSLAVLGIGIELSLENHELDINLRNGNVVFAAVQCFVKY